MRKRTGLRNKYRSGGKSTYSVKRKQRQADRYGTYLSGKCMRMDNIAGRTFSALTSDGDNHG